MIRAIIIDDEPAATELLSTLLREFIPDVDVLGVAHSVRDGIQLIKNENPDLVFLDIQMPQGGGFSLLRSFEELPFSVIFTTAYDQYAIKAIHFSALDYILKPITLERLQDALARYRKLRSKENAPSSGIYLLPSDVVSLYQQNTKIVVPIPKGIKVIFVPEIVVIRGAGVYSEMVLEEGTVQVVSKGLKHFESLLAPLGFVRVHDSFIVNIQHVDRYIRGGVHPVK